VRGVCFVFSLDFVATERELQNQSCRVEQSVTLCAGKKMVTLKDLEDNWSPANGWNTAHPECATGTLTAVERLLR
jgi:hypothetical protein